LVNEWKALAAGEMSRAHAATYLNHAASSPLPRRSAEALRSYVNDRECVFRMYQEGRQDFDVSGLRARLGALLGVPADSLAFVPTTTDGISGILRGIDWRPGDNLVVPADEFPGVLNAALHLRRQGVEVRLVPVAEHLEWSRVDATVDRRTRAVVASHVHWQTGHRLDLAELSQVCRRVDALSIVDAIQSLGQLPVEPQVAGIDVLVAGSYKWLMAIPGTAVLYASDRALAEIAPDRAGWKGAQTSAPPSPRLEWNRDATRFQVGGPCDPTLITLEHSVELLLELGAGAIAAHLRRLQDRLIAGLPERLRVNSSLEPRDRSGILFLTTGSREQDDALVKGLTAAAVIVARRGDGIRVSPHWHNTPADMDRFLDVVTDTLRP
jgi:selenocysteine lyase/cysteine desulfurase